MLFDNIDWGAQGQFLLCIIIAGILGYAIGFERKLRFKEAGVRTHAMVSVGACLMMLVSKFGFSDGSADGARIAAQIVSGIGFIGAGMILYKQQALQGLTTAAGIWTTAGVGMAVGAGMWVLALGATVIIIFVQCLLHLPIKAFKTKHFVQMKICFKCQTDENEEVKRLFKIDKFTKVNMKRGDDGAVNYTAYIMTDKIMIDSEIVKILREHPYIISIERADET